MCSIAHTLATSGLLAAILKWAVVGLLGWIVKLVREHVKHQQAIHELLRTDRPGGLTDIVDAVDRQQDRAVQ